MTSKHDTFKWEPLLISEDRALFVSGLDGKFVGPF